MLLRIVERFLPVLPEEKSEMHRITILDEHFLSTPSFALEQARTATNDMAQNAKEALNLSMDLIFGYSEEKASEVERIEKMVDNYEDQLESYLVKLAKSTMTAKDSHTLSILLHCINDFERITDHALNVSQAAGQLHEKGLTFSQKAQDEMRIYGDAVRAIMNMTVLAFQNDDLSLARQVEPLEEVIDGLNMEEKKRHVRRLRKGKCTIEAGFILSDITTDYERIADHCSNVAVDLLQVNEDGFDTHEYLEREETVNSDEFRAMVQSFEQKYCFPGLRKDDEIPTVESVRAQKGSKNAETGDADRADRTVREDKANKAGKTDKADKTDKSGKTDRIDKTDKAEKKAAKKARKAAKLAAASAAAAAAQQNQQAIAEASLKKLEDS